MQLTFERAEQVAPNCRSALSARVAGRPYAGSMAIQVTRSGAGFDVEVTPPEGSWKSRHPLTPTEVLEQLSALGCHSTAITDALDESGADWRPTHDAEVMRRRREGA